MALLDALQRTSGKGDLEALSKNTKIKNKVKQYALNVINGKNPCLLEQAKEIGKEKQMTFGKAQKLLNMTMKYLYIKYYDDPMRRDYFRCCDAPMDGVMTQKVYERYKKVTGKNPGFRKSTTWSKLSSEDTQEYEAFQSAVNTIITKEKPGMLSIEFDYVAWKTDTTTGLSDFV